MNFKTARSALIAAVAAVGLGVAAPAMASLPYNPNDFGVIEGDGVYTVFNHSDDWFIWAFSVTNPEAGTDGTAWTTRPNWEGDACGGASCANGAPGPAFEYGVSTFISDFANDIGPGETSSQFFFGAAPDSKVTFFLYKRDVGSAFFTKDTSTGAPEPAAWALMIGGFGLAGAALRRRPRTA